MFTKEALSRNCARFTMTSPSTFAQTVRYAVPKASFAKNVTLTKLFSPLAATLWSARDAQMSFIVCVSADAKARVGDAIASRRGVNENPRMRLKMKVKASALNVIWCPSGPPRCFFPEFSAIASY